jgi:hypothetical protein
MSFVEIIHGSLYQADASASSWAHISTLRRTALVIDLHGCIDPPLSPGAVYLRWPIEDGPLPDIGVLSSVERLGANLIQAGGAVVTMCNMGLNRSGLLSALIVSRVQAIDGAQAVRIVQSKCPGALINDNFRTFVERER